MDDLEVESFLSFWADAGVDCAFEDAPQDRMQVAVRPARSAPPSVAIRSAPLDPEVVPETLEIARRLAAVGTLEELEKAIAGFDGCPLKLQGASQAVFAKGRPDASIMVIGEGPGADEDRMGQPFVGRAGKLLDQMLLAAGLDDDVFVTNTVFWRPPGNRTPTPEEQAVCRPFLERAIALVQPSLLLLLGGASAKSMLHSKDGILSLRGRWARFTSADGTLEIPALPTLHPAFLLRQPLAKKKAWADILSLKRRLRTLRAPPLVAGPET